jgi:hypothetical protein
MVLIELPSNKISSITVGKSQAKNSVLAVEFRSRHLLPVGDFCVVDVEQSKTLRFGNVHAEPD